MTVRRILFIAFLLGVWVQSANACQESLGVHEPAHLLMGSPAMPVAGDFVSIGGDQRCECPAAIQNAESIVSETSKSLLAPCPEGADAFPYPSNLDAAAVAMRTRASSFIARRAELPPYLHSPRLLQ